MPPAARCGALAVLLSLLAGGSAFPASPSDRLPAAGDVAATATRYGLEPGVHVLLVGYYPVCDFLDWTDPPMDASSDWVTVEGVQFGKSPGQVDLEQTFQSARLPRRFEGGHWYAAYRADGWLWVEQQGQHAFRIAAADDAGRLTVAGHRAVGRSPREPGEPITVVLQRGFHRFRLDGFNRKWGLGLRTEWKPPGAESFSELPSSRVFRGLALVEGPRVFQVATAGLLYELALPVRGGKPPYRLRVVGALPEGISLSTKGQLHGEPARAGFFRFSVAVADASGQAVEEPLGLRVLPAQTDRSRNDADVLQLAFDDTDPSTLEGGLISGRGMSEGLATAGGYALYPSHPPAEGRARSIVVAEGRGAFGSRRFASIRGAREYGFFFSGSQEQLMSDHMPALRKANRLAVAFRLPRQVAVDRADGPARCDAIADPKTYCVTVLDRVHMAGHNVTRYAGHRKEQWNWHFYHPASRYWGDHWQASNVYYLGDGWWYYVTSNQSTNQRSGTVDLAGWYEPQQDTDARYFDSLNRFYHVIDHGWGKTYNAYDDPTFDVDQIRIWREEPGVEIRHSEARKVARLVIADERPFVDVPFGVTHAHARPARYWVARYGGKVPQWNGQGIFVDRGGNRAIDPDDPELDVETPSFEPGEAKCFVYRVSTDSLAAGRTKIAGVSLRVHDPADPLSLRGDSMMILIHRAADPGQVHRESLTTLSKDAVPENRPPSARIEGPRVVSVAPGKEVRLRGTVADLDGPEQPLAAWDFGDASAVAYGPDVGHRYAEPGTYTVRLRATDGILERSDVVTVRVASRR
ncbi:MAG: PKD domain-containing protein [Planctomycetota bacterium]|jgi:hypothetical protein